MSPRAPLVVLLVAVVGIVLAMAVGFLSVVVIGAFLTVAIGALLVTSVDSFLAVSVGLFLAASVEIDPQVMVTVMTVVVSPIAFAELVTEQFGLDGRGAPWGLGQPRTRCIVGVFGGVPYVEEVIF